MRLRVFDRTSESDVLLPPMTEDSSAGAGADSPDFELELGPDSNADEEADAEEETDVKERPASEYADAPDEDALPPS